jgi:putative two-component system response regulator
MDRSVEPGLGALAVDTGTQDARAGSGAGWVGECHRAAYLSLSTSQLELQGHTDRVSGYCALLAKLSGLDRRRCELIGSASMMHDIGKLSVPRRILRKRGLLSSSERRQMQRHADFGHEMLAGASDPLLELAAEIAWTHHERWDGGGYPRRMRGEEIPVEGRIAAIGHVFDALTSDRVYRPAMSLEHALGLMRAGRGRQFDPELLDLFIGALPQMLAIRRRHPDRAATRTAAVIG